MPAQGVECGWKPAGWHVLTLLNSRPPSLPQPPEPTFAAPPKVLPEHHELVVGRGALLNSRIPSLPRPQEPISCSVNEHVFQASRAWDRASVGQARIHTCLGAEAGATMLTNTHTHNTHRLLPPSRLISKIHIWGWGLGGLGHELRNRAPCNNGSRSANRLASKQSSTSSQSGAVLLPVFWDLLLCGL